MSVIVQQVDDVLLPTIVCGELDEQSIVVETSFVHVALIIQLSVNLLNSAAGKKIESIRGIALCYHVTMTTFKGDVYLIHVLLVFIAILVFSRVPDRFNAKKTDSLP